LESLLEFVKFTRKLATSEALVPHLGWCSSEIAICFTHVSRLGKEINPGPDIQTDEELSLWIKKNIASTFHGAGSCAMMPRDKGGVVDPELKVYGTRNLRVVDLSIVPLHLNCHTQSIVYGIAEQGTSHQRNICRTLMIYCSRGNYHR
jgi:choline dehydrogenase-like flavoprotein